MPPIVVRLPRSRSTAILTRLSASSAGVAAFLVAQDPARALAVARDLARQGDDTTELFEAAMAALIRTPASTRNDLTK